MTFAGKDKLICHRQTLKPESPHILLNFSCDWLWLSNHSSFKTMLKVSIVILPVCSSKVLWGQEKHEYALDLDSYWENAKKWWKKKYFGNINSGRLYINSKEINLGLKILYRCWWETCLGLQNHKLIVYNFLMQSQN